MAGRTALDSVGSAVRKRTLVSARLAPVPEPASYCVVRVIASPPFEATSRLRQRQQIGARCAGRGERASNRLTLAVEGLGGPSHIETLADPRGGIYRWALREL